MAYKFQLGAARLSGSLVQEGPISADGGAVSGSGNLDIGGNAEIAGTVKLAGIAEAALDVNADFLYFQDADGTMKKEATGDYAAAMAGVGIGVDSGVLKLDLGELSTAAVADGDFFGFIDATDGSNKKDAIADLASLFAGAGLSAASSVIALDIDELSALGSAGLHQTQDHFAFSDNGTEKKITFSNLQDAVFADVSGDATIAAGGVLTIAAASVENSMLADDAVGADELAANAVVNASVVDGSLNADKLDIDGSTDIGADLVDADLMIVDDGAGGTNRKSTLTRVKKYIYSALSGDAAASDAGVLTIANDAVEQAMIADDAVGADQLASNAVVNASVASNAAIDFNKIATNVDMGGNFTIGNQSDDIATFSGPVVVGGNLTVNGALTSINSTTIEITSSFTFEGPADAHETILTCATPGADTTLSLPTLSLGSYFIPALADAATDASAAVTAAEFALLDGASSVGTPPLADGDGFLHNDAGTMKQTNILKIAEYAYAKFSGDATVSSAGVLTIANDAVESGMLNDNIISGQTELAGGSAVDADEMLISDGGTLKKIGLDSLKTYMSDIAADVAIKAAGNTLAVGINYFADMSSDGEDAVTLPASAGMTVGQSVRVKAPSDCGAARYITINKAGSQTIDGAASIRLESPFAAVELVYVAADLWRVF
tara:strand:+ start:75 stop:2072 length:1998 start_codon:yes stop_codon:yes gene_type:complete